MPRRRTQSARLSRQRVRNLSHQLQYTHERRRSGHLRPAIPSGGQRGQLASQIIVGSVLVVPPLGSTRKAVNSESGLPVQKADCQHPQRAAARHGRGGAARAAFDRVVTPRYQSGLQTRRVAAPPLRKVHHITRGG